MTTITAQVESTDLTVLAEQISEAHKNCVASQLNALQHALDCGRLAVAAKSQLKHGEFLPWVDKHTSVGRRTMQVYMDIAVRWPTIEAKAQSAAHLSMAAALKLLADERRLEKVQQILDVAGDDLAFDMVGDKPILNATTVKKLAKLPPEKIKRATRFDNSDIARSYNAKNFLKRCKKPEAETHSKAEVVFCDKCHCNLWDEDGNCLRCNPPDDELTATVTNHVTACPECGCTERTDEGDCAKCYCPCGEDETATLEQQPGPDEPQEKNTFKVFLGEERPFSGLDAVFSLWGVVTDELRDWPPSMRKIAADALRDMANKIMEGRSA